MTDVSAGRPILAVTTRVVVRVVLYYFVLIGAAVFAWRHLPRTQSATLEEIAAILGGAAPPMSAAHAARAGSLGDLTPALSVVLAMLSAALLALPVAWVYLLTRAKRGYQQSVVHTMLLLPMVVAGIVVLVRDSLALAFSLAGIVAAVRFRTPLDDSKDAVYVFLATGIGLAAAINLPVAVAISICFNAAILVLWHTDFGRSPVQLEGRLADQRLKRARALARTGTFVARIDDEVFRDMTAEQLEGVAERAQRRARQHHPEAAAPEDAGTGEALLLVRTGDVAAARRTVERQLQEHVKRWSYHGTTRSADGTDVIQFVFVMRRGRPAEEFIDRLRASAMPELAWTSSRTRSPRARTSAAVAPRIVKMKLACNSLTAAPPTRSPFRPAMSINRPAWSPGGLRNTLPAF